MLSRKLFPLLFSAIAANAALWAQMPIALQVQEFTLGNGMTVWLNEDHSQPKVYGGVLVRAGGKDCPDTGIAHYFEHIMFKGTDRIGTVDYEAERPWLDSISAQYDLLSQTTDAARRTAIQQHINELSLWAADYSIPNEFNRLISQYGGTGLNAGTSQDMTVYYNMFLPQYMEQWCWLNSERLLHPVFRGFQAELENVYEEKNRASDGMRSAYDAVMRAVFKQQPYAFPVLGSTENLKNPRLSDMEAFYKKYYVASNMCLMLTGDIKVDDSLKALLEKTFGRMPRGRRPDRQQSSIPPFAKGEQADIKLPIPIVKAEALVWRAPTAFAPDADALILANRLLSDEKAGMLDSLANEHAVMAAGAMHVSMDDAGATALYVVPKIPFGKKKKAEALCLQQLERLMQGDFTEERLEQHRRSLLMEMEQGIETIERRAELAVEVCSQGRSWQDYLDRIERLRHISKADVVAAARKYYSDEHLTLHKKYGTEKKETLSQPGYVPVKPRNTGAKSAFAQWLEQMPVGSQPIRTVDFDRDVERSALADHASLLYTPNPVNDIFTLTLRYLDGSRHTPLLAQLGDFLSAIGTDSLKKQQLEIAWQRIGVSMEVGAGTERFTFTLTGRDADLEPALRLLAHFLAHAKGDEDALKDLKQEARVQHKSFGKQKDDVLQPMLQYVCYGQQSPYLQQPSLQEIKALNSDRLLELFRDLQHTACDVVYVGGLPAEQVASLVRQTLPLDQCTRSGIDTHRPLLAQRQPTVYFYHVPKSRQNYVCSYEQLPAQPEEKARSIASLWARYVGGGMSSLLFQNIREFQSLAYATQGQLVEPNYAIHPDAPMAFVTITGTQADKTQQVMQTVDSLLRQMPMKTENLKASRQELLSRVQNSYPSFRQIGYYVGNMLQKGYTADPNQQLVHQLPLLTQTDVEQFQRQHVAANQRVWIVIGDRKLTDFSALSRYGQVVELKKEEIYR